MSTQDTSIVIAIPERESLPPSLLSNIEAGFIGFFEQVSKWESQALAVKVTNVNQKAEMKMAFTMRQALRKTRTDADKKRAEMKADSLRMGRAIDGVYNLLEAAIVPLERHLKAQEEFAERLMEEQRLRIKAEREAAIAPLITEGQIIPALDVMTEDAFAGYLADTKLLFFAKIEAAKKAEADRIAREQAEAAERERMRQENARLLKEAAEREAAAQKEREAAEAERQRLESIAAKERAEAAAKLKAEQDKAAKAAEEQCRIAAKAAQAAEAKALAERQAAEQKLAAERQERHRLEAEAAAKQAKELAAAQAEIARKAAEESAPDKERLTKLAADIRALNVPVFTSKKAITLADQIKSAIEQLALRVEASALKL